MTGLAVVTLAVGLGLGWLVGSAVDGGGDEKASPSPSATSGRPTPRTTPAAGSGQYQAPPWSGGVVTSVNLVGSFEADGFTMDVYRLAQVTVTDGSRMSDPASVDNFYPNESLKPGDVVNVYSCVITNTGIDPISLRSSSIRARLYLDNQGRSTYLDNYSLQRKYHISPYLDGIATKTVEDLRRGESVSVGGFALSQPGKTLNIQVTLSPADDATGGRVRSGALHLLME